jgi:hypothetical protein
MKGTVKGIKDLSNYAASVAQIGEVLYQQKQLTFVLPSAPAMFLNLSHDHYLKAEKRLVTAVRVRKKGRTKGMASHVHLFGFLESIMASTVFAFTALEAFVNEKIPDSYVHEQPEKQHTKTFNKDQLERSLSLTVKLADALPKALSLPSPKGTQVWERYVALNKLRDRIIHLKAADREPHTSRTDSLWSELVKHPLPETFSAAKDVMLFFYAADKSQPRWLRDCPF